MILRGVGGGGYVTTKRKWMLFMHFTGTTFEERGKKMKQTLQRM